MSDNMVRPKSLKFLAITKVLVFEVAFRHGNGTRWVDVVFPAEELIKISDILKAQDPDYWGHAFWHYVNKRPVPCSSCNPIGKKVVVCKDGNCNVHYTKEGEVCYKAIDA